MLLSVLIFTKFCAFAPLQPWLHRLINTCCVKIKVLTLFFFQLEFSPVLLFRMKSSALASLITILVFYRPLLWVSVFVPSYSFPRISEGFMKTSFFAFPSAFQYSPGPSLKKVHHVSDNYKPPIKNLHHCIIQTLPYFSVHYCPVLYPCFANSWKKHCQNRGLLVLCPEPHQIISLPIIYYHRGFAYVFNNFSLLILLAWDHGLPVQIGKLLPKPLFKNWVWQEPSVLPCLRILWFPGKFHTHRKESFMIPDKINWEKKPLGYFLVNSDGDSVEPQWIYLRKGETKSWCP